jgi:hypothetical protein
VSEITTESVEEVDLVGPEEEVIVTERETFEITEKPDEKEEIIIASGFSVISNVSLSVTITSSSGPTKSTSSTLSVVISDISVTVSVIVLSTVISSLTSSSSGFFSISI